MIMTTHQPPSSAGNHYRSRATTTDGAPQWGVAGACRRSPNADDWFPENRQQRQAQPALRARRICFDHCIVRTLCLNHALDNHEPWGIWGGLDEKERDALFGDDRRGVS